MNIKLRLGEVIRLIDNRLPIEQVSKQLTPIAEQAGIYFAELQTGTGYLQWFIPGSDWTSFADADEAQKSVVALTYHDRKETMQRALHNSPLKDVVFRVPSEKSIFFRQKGDNVEIAVTAWGFKFPNKPDVGELDTYILKHNLQKVSIAFEWDKQYLSNFCFKLVGQPRQTSADGWFCVDGPLPVGKTFPVQAEDGKAFSILVEKGKDEYVFDLTQYFNVDIAVYQDGVAAAQRNCHVCFNGHDYDLSTDGSGRAAQQIPLAPTIEGLVAFPQPLCDVKCDSQNQQQTPLSPDSTLSFVFNFETEKPEPTPEPEVKEKPMEGRELGRVKEEPEPEPEVKEKPEEEPEPEYVYIQLKDYGGEPLPDLPFTLTTKKQGTKSLITDSRGMCKVLKEWFSPKEKMKVNFVIDTEYQLNHDLHDNKNKNHKSPSL